jgi:hypothetical protein
MFSNILSKSKTLGFIITILIFNNRVNFGQSDNSILSIKKTTDFEFTGNGSSNNWQSTDWLEISQRTSSSEALKTKLKILYSESGLYFLFDCQDNNISAALNADFSDLWHEDVVEVFLWPDETIPAYFEYELSPLNHELAILISNVKGDIVRWQPFHYDSDRKTRHFTATPNGQIRSNSQVTGWTAEFFIPFKLLRPLKNILPTTGTKWKANFYRVDIDKMKTSWSWQLTQGSFHDINKFGILEFE